MDSQQTYHFDGTDGRFDGVDMSDAVLPACLLAPLEGPQETDDCEAEVAADSYSYAGLMTMGMRGGSAMAGMGTRTEARRKKRPVLILADDEREAARRQLDVIAVQDFSENTFVERTPAAPVLGALAGQNACRVDSPDGFGPDGLDEQAPAARTALEAFTHWDAEEAVPEADPFALAANRGRVPVDFGAFEPPHATDANAADRAANAGKVETPLSYTVPAWNTLDEEPEGDEEEGLDEGAYAPLAAHYAQDANGEPDYAPDDFAHEYAGGAADAFASLAAPSHASWTAQPAHEPVAVPVPDVMSETINVAPPVVWPEAEPVMPAPLPAPRVAQARAGHALRARVRSETPPEPVRPSLMGALLAWLGRLFRGS
ncbi:hypothetical protein MTR62_10810 [Novosphingobium sp. 1949]|uniref:Uncharacterized protein n=1 Tax=Novosphingobium organovorum TaxID=2930092 RepID=A0ABT0BEG4_9SPHN|nr:hypothetical protein [Novosphingobium organovorum]MCJ2183179.1 hypothetical protein [Novosphingobium organovorum]